jgi:phosphatidate cytidylyltransferase
VRQRTISAAVLVPVVVGVFLLGPPWLTLGLVLLAVAAGVEVFRLLAAAGLPVGVLPGVVAPPVAVLGLAWEGAPPGAGVAFVAAVLIVSALDAFRRLDVRDGLQAWMATSFGALYASSLGFLAAILVVAPAVPAGAPAAGLLDAGRAWLAALVLLVWSFDTCAYLAGRALGRGRLMRHISPGKTWSGAIGGTLAAVAVGGVAAWALGQWLPAGLLLGLLVAVAAQAGDLAESLLKRAAGAKDSGSLIPGHGGVLDRVDSFLFAAPAMVAWLLVAGPGAAGGT